MLLHLVPYARSNIRLWFINWLTAVTLGLLFTLVTFTVISSVIFPFDKSEG